MTREILFLTISAITMWIVGYALRFQFTTAQDAVLNDRQQPRCRRPMENLSPVMTSERCTEFGWFGLSAGATHDAPWLSRVMLPLLPYVLSRDT